MKGDRGDLRRLEREGDRSKAAEAGRRGRPEEREGERRSGAWAGSPMGNREESCERGERSGAGRGDFLVLF